jgi:hypothetical protein
LTLRHNRRTLHYRFNSWLEFTDSQWIRNAPRRAVIESAPKHNGGCGFHLWPASW